MFKDNWAYWSYDGNKNSPRSSKDSKFDFNCCIVQNTNDHLQTLKNVAAEIYERYGPIDILFSGGLNSQIILKCFIDLGIPVNIKIFSYENNINYHWDVAAAEKFCKDHSLHYQKINFDLQKFFENDAEDFFLKSFNADVSKLPVMRMIEYCDNVPIIGTAYPLISRSNFFYDDIADWELRILESEINLMGYTKLINRPVISNFFLYDKDFLSTLLETELIKNLISDKFKNCSSSFNIRNQIYNLNINRVSQKGLEWENNSWLYPQFVLDFHYQYINRYVKSKMKIFKINDLYKFNM